MSLVYLCMQKVIKVYNLKNLDNVDKKDNIK